MKHRFFTLDVFTDRAFGGNQLAVFPEAATVPAERMQDIAREFNFSETVFVLPPEDPAHARRLRIFTPGAELPFAGHPTVGTAHLLAATGAVPTVEGDNSLVLEEGVGPVRVSVRKERGVVTFVQLSVAKLPERLESGHTLDGIAEALSLSREDLAEDDVGPVAYSCGVPFLFARLRDVAAVGRAELNYAAWKRSLARRGTNEVFFFAEGGRLHGADIHGRMFAPGLGVFEDPATGSAVAALAGYLVALQKPADGTAKWTVEQGIEMGRASLLHLEADVRGGMIFAVRVGGRSVVVTEGTMEVA
ncbi:MAG: PhzF family phenazine biosynthesis protein [Gemmatimonadaceae bacterium]|nr:PhzF family phenazine biosynthesis protein [Gemmatimonadaceae bacterium]